MVGYACLVAARPNNAQKCFAARAASCLEHVLENCRRYRLAEQETLLRYNGMLQSTWELLDATRERLAAATAAAQARHAYWTAWLDWQLLLAGGPYRATATDAPSASAGTASEDH